MDDEVVKRIAALETELAALKAQVVKPPEKPIERKPWPKYDPTEGFRLPASAAKAMAAIVPDPKPGPGFNAHAHAQTKPGVPGGFGPPNTEPAKPVERGSGWTEPRPLEGPSGLRYVDQQIDVQDAIDRRELERKLGVGAKHGSK